MRKLKFHKKKLLKKVNFIEWKRERGHREALITRRYHVTGRDNYKNDGLVMQAAGGESAAKYFKESDEDGFQKSEETLLEFVFVYHEGFKKWVEVGNSGMFRPEMLLPMGFPEDVSVIAWGHSLERSGRWESILISSFLPCSYNLRAWKSMKTGQLNWLKIAQGSLH